MSRTEDKYIVALDIGTSKVCTLVAEISERGQLEIIGKGTSPMKGTRRGNIINLDQAIEAVKKAVDEAEVMAGLQIESVYVGVSGDHIRSVNSRGVVSVMGKHKEIGREDIDRVIEASKSINIPAELELLHVIPRQFVVDGQDGIHDPIGMTATRLEANVHIVTGARTHHQNVLTCVNKAGIAVQELVLEQLAAAEAVLTQDEREMGVLLMDIGGGTTDYAVFLEGNVVHTNVLPVGAGHFTSDISVVLRTPMEDAERIKKRYGCALSSLVTSDDPIEVPTVGGRAPKILSRQELTGILEPRAAEIAKLVYRDLEKVGLDKEIRSGVVLVGGGAEMEGMVEMVEQVFDQSARKGVPRGFGGLADTVSGPEWAAAAGLLLWGLRTESKVRARRPRKGLAKVADSVKSWFAWA
ncbi:MAG TPA: cell division protein FtsA [Thermoanaerobaculia bacterium]|jgi:cell division protein FtsA|nr:cell division protein FtsA [Thermoanaerobaculia bacterium]